MELYKILFLCEQNRINIYSPIFFKGSNSDLTKFKLDMHNILEKIAVNLLLRFDDDDE
jgi:hypothetical protein